MIRARGSAEMGERFSESEVLARVTTLTQLRLAEFVQAEIVLPERDAAGLATYAPRDLARLELLCELDDAFDLGEERLALVMGLIDQLHRAEADLTALATALQAEPEEIRRRIGRLLQQQGG
ncbi:hypothetical protein FGG78_32460 [Thioclava sp. BHET1]|nr:hypothetical protein FGG78_32460 [Thioclava sp. BHET1]